MFVYTLVSTDNIVDVERSEGIDICAKIFK